MVAHHPNEGPKTGTVPRAYRTKEKLSRNPRDAHAFPTRLSSDVEGREGNIGDDHSVGDSDRDLHGEPGLVRHEIDGGVRLAGGRLSATSHSEDDENEHINTELAVLPPPYAPY